jgi:PKD domain
MRGTARPSPGPSRMLRMLLVPACFAAALACSRAPTEKAEGPFLDDGYSLSSDADADTYTGPASLTVAFTAHAIHGVGRTTYHWSFDDHGTSEEQNPVHTFARQGWYRVVMNAKDGAGGTDQTTLLLHVWRPRDWARLQRHRDMRIVMRSLRELKRKNGDTSPTPIARN